ncbi:MULTISPECIES: TniQ family protein [unclassified Mycolicibacterium]|uniref:TniQ family protein n=1 Tax=unclassified Mycolicibacterium TaxID=2636767 RepID=UPI0013911543|nr:MULTISPECIES: TniQ family protein [unclassified Mycolicibacterium]
MTIGDDETVESWLARAASRYALTPRELIAEAGIYDDVRRPVQLVRAVREHADRLAQLLGCEDADVCTAETEMLPNAAIVDYLQRYHSTSRPVPAGAAFCPLCLAQPDPQWKREWASIFSIACTDHGCLLVRTCPRCGDLPFSTASWLSREPDVPAYACPNRPRRSTGRMIQSRRCQFDLRTVEPFDMDGQAVDAHVLANDLWRRYVHAPMGLLRLAGVEVTSLIAFDALCQLLDESIRIVSLFEPAFSRPALVQALRNAAQVLNSPSAAEAAEQADAVGLLNPAGPVTPLGPDQVLLRRKRNPLLAAIRLGAVRPTLSPAAQLTFDCGHPHPRYPLRDNDDEVVLRLPEHEPGIPEMDRARIPQVLWPGTVWTADSATTPLAAAAQAMALTKIGDTRSWSIIALDLGLPKQIALPVTQYWRRIVRAGLWPEALAALTHVKEQLRDHRPPIDYQQRRIIADDPTRLRNALNEAGADGKDWIDEQSQHLLRRFWELFTGGDIRYAAGQLSLSATELDNWPTKRVFIDNKYGGLFVNAYDWMTTCSPSLRPCGPLTWQPP